MFYITGTGYDSSPAPNIYFACLFITWLYLVLVAACGIFLVTACKI